MTELSDYKRMVEKPHLERMRRLLAAKDAEIERLTAERDDFLGRKGPEGTMMKELAGASRVLRGRRMKVVNHPNRKKANRERAVVVTTAHRGVFFGYTSDTEGAIIKLRAARNCLYWPAEQKGFMGLAASGPMEGSRIGPAADIELRDITSVVACTDDAVKAWENAPWSR